MATKKAAGKTAKKSQTNSSYKTQGKTRRKPAINLQEPIIITGGGSVNVIVNPGQFRSNGSGNLRNGSASLGSVIINGGAPIPLTPNSVVVVRMA